MAEEGVRQTESGLAQRISTPLPIWRITGRNSLVAVISCYNENKTVQINQQIVGEKEGAHEKTGRLYSHDGLSGKSVVLFPLTKSKGGVP